MEAQAAAQKMAAQAAYMGIKKVTKYTLVKETLKFCNCYIFDTFLFYYSET